MVDLYHGQLAPISLQEDEKNETWESHLSPVAPTGNPTTPPNAAGPNQDTEATRRPPPTTFEVLHDSEISEGWESRHDGKESIAEMKSDLLHHIWKLERAAKHPPPPPTINHNDPAMVGKQATLTTKVAELQRQSLLTIIHSAKPPPPPAGPT